MSLNNAAAGRGTDMVSWDEEWAQLKADALARQQQSAHMQLNQLVADGGGGSAAGPGGRGDGFSVSADSIDGSSHLLLEIAGVLSTASAATSSTRAAVLG
ncbi:hypothetical protein [Streptomyces sp. NPDC051636]|uniref:hypothetical protein n=1 Tax=Streptomyces sp. NPDC051636 TaxID=3365663 RepID=UPI0037A99DDD